MKYRIKFLLIFINITVFIGCASNFLDNTLQPNKTILIDKPKVSFDLKKLPQKINIFTFDTNSRQEIEFIKGTLANYYYYSNQIEYAPQLNFITESLLKKKNCSLKLSSQEYSIIFLTQKFRQSLSPSCLNKILKIKGVLVTQNKELKVNSQLQTIFNLGRLSEYESLLSYAKDQGSRSSLIIYDQNTLEKENLKKIWENFEGKVLETSASNNRLNDNLLSNVLLIQRSKERSRELSRVLSTSLEHTPRRRMDIDVIFLSVSLSKARTLKPELEYNFGESIPVYLLPHWKDEGYYLDKELDLGDVTLVDLPWMYNSEVPYIDNGPKNRNRYFAFGYDSYDISLLLNNPSSLKQFKYIGMSGQLQYRNGKLTRRSLKAKIESGVFKPIGY